MHYSRQPRTAIAFAVAAALSTGLVGCVAQPPGVPGELITAVTDAESAASTGFAVCTQAAKETTWPTVAKTTMSDMLKALTDAGTTVTEVESTTAQEERARRTSLAAIRDATDSLAECAAAERAVPASKMQPQRIDAAKKRLQSVLAALEESR